MPKEEDGELPDPYVKLYLLPDRSKDSKRKTDVIKDDCNPKYDERFEYPIPPNELTQRTLEVSVINKKGLLFLQRSPKMGQVRKIFCYFLLFYTKYETHVYLFKNTWKPVQSRYLFIYFFHVLFLFICCGEINLMCKIKIHITSPFNFLEFKL